MVAQHLLRQARPALVRVGLPLPVGSRVGDRAVYPAATGVPGAAHTLAHGSRWHVALALLCVAAHMAYQLPIGGDHFEFRPLDFYWPLLADSCGRRHRSARFQGCEWPAEAVPSSGLGGQERRPARSRSSCPCCSTLTRFRVSCFTRGPRKAEFISKLNEENAGWLLHAPGMPALVAISNDMRRLVVLNGVALRFPLHRDFAPTFTFGNHTKKWSAVSSPTTLDGRRRHG